MRTSSSVVVSLLGLCLGACVAELDTAAPDDPTKGTDDSSTVSARLAPAPNWVAGLPADAIVGGTDSDGTPLYMCRAAWNGGIHPGKTRRDWGLGCDIGFGGTERWATDSQALVPAWAGATNGSIPVGAIAFGTEATNEALFMCRAAYANGLHPGKIRSGFAGCSIPYGGVEVAVAQYEVMTNPDHVPLHAVAAFATLPADAIVGGRDGDGAALYPCIAPYQGGFQLGKTRAGWGSCDIGYGGGEHWVPVYSVLAPEFNAPVLNAATRPYQAGGENGGALGLCAARWGNSVQVGKYLSNQRCNFGFGGTEVSITSNYQVLSTWATTEPIRYDTGYIAFDGGVPVGGSGQLTINFDGTYFFAGGFHDSGGWCFDDKLALVIKSKNGQAFTFSHSGSMGGTFCGGSRDDSWTLSGNSVDVARAWTDLRAGYVVRWNASSSLDFAGLFKSVMDGIGYVQSVIAIVGVLA